MLRMSMQRSGCMYPLMTLKALKAFDAESYLVGSPGHAAGFINEGEHSQVGVHRGPLQQVQAVLVVNELHIAPVNALSSIFLLWHKGSSQTGGVMSVMNP